MERERKGKSILIGVLCAIILVMSIGFADYARRVTITGDASIGNTWNVRVTSIEQESATGGVEEVDDASHTTSSASFNVTLAEPGDSVSYKVIVTNLGTIPAIITNSEKTGDDQVSAIEFTISGPVVGEDSAKLAAGATHEFIVTATYLESATGDDAPENNAAETATFVFDYEQDLSAAA